MKLKNILKSTMCIGLSVLMLSPLALVNSNAQTTMDAINEIKKLEFGGSGKTEIVKIIPTNNDYVTIGITNSTDIEGTVSKGSSDGYITKFDKELNIVSNKLIGGNKFDDLADLIKVKDGYIGVGTTASTNLEGITNKGNFDAWIIKLDEDFNVVKQTTLIGNTASGFINIIEVEDGYIALGKTSATSIEGINNNEITNNGDEDILIVKYDKNLNRLNHKLIGGTGKDFVCDNGVIKTDNGFVFYASTQSENILGLTNNSVAGERDYLFVEMDNNLNILNKTIFGGNRNDGLYNFIKTDTGYLGLGFTYSTNIEGIDIHPTGYTPYFVEFDKSLNIIRKKALPIGDNYKYTSYCFMKTKNGYKSVGTKATADSSTVGLSIMDFDKDLNLINEYYDTEDKSIYTACWGDEDNFIITGMATNRKGIIKQYKKTYSSSDELQVTVEADNSLELALSTNQITFSGYNGTQDFTNNDLNVTVSSGLSYDLSATMLEEFTPTFDSSATLDSSNLQIKTSNDSNYTPFTTIGDKVMLVANAPNGKDNVHNINFKLIGDSSVKADTYNTSIKFEAEQK